MPSHVLVAPLQGLQECTRGVLLLNGHSVHFSNIGVLKTGSNLANKRLRGNAQKNRAESANRGHSSKPNLLSFSVCNKVLMSL